MSSNRETKTMKRTLLAVSKPKQKKIVFRFENPRSPIMAGLVSEFRLKSPL